MLPNGFAVFSETTTAKNKPLLTFLSRHYMDCLLQSIRARCTAPDSAIIEAKMHVIITREFRRMYRFANLYQHFVDYKLGAPYRAVRGAVVITVEDALAMEDDGLEVATDCMPLF